MAGRDRVRSFRGASGCGRQLGLPLIATYHTNFPAYSAHYGLGWMRSLAYRYLRWVHNSCALTLCPSLATLADLRAHGFRRLRLWRRGVDTARFHPRYRSLAWREAIGAQPGETLLLYVGRLATEKRLDLLADALDGLEGVRLVLVGDGPARPALERRLAGRPVSFTGFLRGEALATAYASSARLHWNRGDMPGVALPHDDRPFPLTPRLTSAGVLHQWHSTER